MSNHGYSVRSYGDMITRGTRMDAWTRALRDHIGPETRVLELGTGPGVFALIAAKFGAASVTAIEPDPSVEIGRIAARQNGLADKVTFLRGLSTDYHPEERADLIFSDMRGAMPLYQHHLPCIVDARERLLAPGGRMIARRDRIYAALVEDPEIDAGYRSPWKLEEHGLDLSAALPFVMNSWRATWMPRAKLLTDPVLFAELDYATLTESDWRAKLFWRTGRPGCAHGILLWFDCELAPGIVVSNAPGEPEQVYGQAYFPLEAPVPLLEDMPASVEISAKLIGGDYVWSWSFSGKDASGQPRRFRQSSFKADVPDQSRLKVREAGFRPPAREEYQIDRFCLRRFDGETSLGTIARELRERFPSQFATEQSALDHVAKVSARYHS